LELSRQIADALWPHLAAAELEPPQGTGTRTNGWRPHHEADGVDCPLLAAESFSPAIRSQARQ